MREVVDLAPGDGAGDGREAPHVRTSRVRSAREAPKMPSRAEHDRDREAALERLGVPARDDDRADPLEQVGDRVPGRDRAEPVLLDQRPRERLRGQEEEDEEHREEALHRLARPGAQPDERAQRGEGERDQEPEHDEHDRRRRRRP